jgi:hypothetical protein
MCLNFFHSMPAGIRQVTSGEGPHALRLGIALVGYRAVKDWVAPVRTASRSRVKLSE